MKPLVTLALLLCPSLSFALEGNWIRTYQGGYGHSVLETADGGAILGGTFGAGFDCCRPWVVKLNADGTPAWEVTYDAPGLAGANNLVPTRDGGYVFSGEGTSFMLVKIDAAGNVLWARDYGDGGYSLLRVVEADDGSLLLTGATAMDDPNASNGRAVLVDPNGEVIWQKIYGRPGPNEFFADAIQGYNGNFIVAGSTRGDYWLAELDRATGAVVWQNAYGGGAEDTGLVVTPVLKRYYMVVGASDSFADGGLRNWWAVIVGQNGKISKEFSLGGADAEDPHAAIATSDGGFLIGGGSGSFNATAGEIWLVKFDARAKIEWQKSYGIPDRTDSAWEIQETATGYTVIGDSYSFPIVYEHWLMRIDRNGNVEDASCGVVRETKVPLRATNANVREAGAQAVDTKIPPVDLEVVPTFFELPIEACVPTGGR
ncbi:MAG TPA: hypothetical protein VF139_05895 [Candidatus Polarisedimenticolaceae bacterium]